MRVDIREVLALNLRRHWQAAGLSQEELAARTGVGRTYVSSIERCVYAASIDVVDTPQAGIEGLAPTCSRREGAPARLRAAPGP